MDVVSAEKKKHEIKLSNHSLSEKSNKYHNTLQKIQYRKFETKILRKGIARSCSPNFHIHVSVSHLYIPTIDLSILLQEICGPILGIYKLLTDT
jgi:hypothetical protein